MDHLFVFIVMQGEYTLINNDLSPNGRMLVSTAMTVLGEAPCNDPFPMDTNGTQSW